MTVAVLSLRGITKHFGPVAALLDVDIDVVPGEVHAVLGENGAGKSTLMKVVYGLLQPDAGAMRLRGEPAHFRSPLDARRAGIGMVHQEFALVDALSIAENLLLSLHPSTRWRWRRNDVDAAARQLAAQLGIELGDLDTPVGMLPVGQRQRIEIMKALAGQPRILILDEPTAVLTPVEVEALFGVLDRLRRAGTAVLFITHKLPEVMAIADRITIMRRARVVARAGRGELGVDELGRLMVGPLAIPSSPQAPPPGAASAGLALTDVVAVGDRGLAAIDGISLSVRRGEIFGVAGVDGNGQAELFEVLAGARPPHAGTVAVAGTAIRHFTPATMSAAGIACVPPDRLRQGVVAAMSVRENAVLNVELLRRLSPGLLTQPAAEIAAARTMVERYAIRVGSLDDPVRSLSGGNMQKLIVARALSLEPRVLVAVNPTRGLDIAAARGVHAAFAAGAARGAAVLLISTELDEILAHAHRLAVLYRGRLSPVLERPFPGQRIGALLAGAGEAGTAHRQP
jgi:general nucleoside transport system ATP-binding protein